MGARAEVLADPIVAVDPETVESLIEQRKLGERIKRLRLRKSMGLVELGEKTGLSASFLSQLETGVYKVGRGPGFPRRILTERAGPFQAP